MQEELETKFRLNIINLERLNQEFFQPNKDTLAGRSSWQVPPLTIDVESQSSDTTIPIDNLVIDDYTRTNRIYCMMLWVYWEALGRNDANTSGFLDELKCIRNCLAHHDGNLAKYSQDPNPKYREGGKRLLEISKGKSYVKNYNLIFEAEDLTRFTEALKVEFKKMTGKVL